MFELPFWLSGFGSFIKFAKAWFSYIQSILEWPLNQFDVDNAELFFVDLLAWERGVERFSNEPEWLYRRRVKFAFQNAKDAGSVQGFVNIWLRMELGNLSIEERLPDQDWDLVRLIVSESLISERQDLLDILVEKYGRTCRRYSWLTSASNVINVRVGNVQHENSFLTASL
jgi:hypothetical protein